MNPISKVFVEKNLGNGRIISMSKSSYRQKFPDNEAYFNVNIFTLEDGKIWYGDIDLTKEKNILEQIAESIGKDLYLLKELDGRFENENLKESEIISKAITKINKK